jgi:NADH:ubiquinone oxidoreductase subunit H
MRENLNVTNRFMDNQGASVSVSVYPFKLLNELETSYNVQLFLLLISLCRIFFIRNGWASGDKVA